MIITTCLIAWMPGSILGSAASGVAARAPAQAATTTARRTATAPTAADRTARLSATDHRTAAQCTDAVGSTRPSACRLYRIATMRRSTLLLVLVVAALGLVAAGCGGEQSQTATPETVQGEVTTTETTTTETETTTSESTETETTSEATTTETSAGPPKGDPVAGKAIFLGTSGCTGCHTLADAGSTGTV